MSTLIQSVVVSIFLAAVAGCASIESVYEKHSLITYSDGVDREEAKLIAQKAFWEIPYGKGPYDVLKPAIVTLPQTSSYPNFWFISLPSKEKNSSLSYVYAIDKRTGGIMGGGKWYKDKHPDLTWLFNR